MAFVRVMCKARKIEKLRKELEDEKKKSFETSKGEKVQYSIKQKYRHFWIDLKIKIRNWFKKKCTFPKHSCLYKTVYKAKRDGTCENFTLKSIIGFISGFFLTYIFFMFFVFILNFKLSTATIMCSFFGSILTIGLAFSYKVRCVVFLLLPQFFSKRGRQALMAYAFILAITGPAKNTLHNMGILSESLACGQEQLKAAVRQIIDVVKKPFYAIRDAIKAVVATVKVIVKKIKEVLLTIKRIIMAILKVIKAAFQFLGKILNICNKELGTPFQRCTRVFENAITDCHAKLGPLFSWLCSITYLVQSVCYIVKIFDFICMIVDFISDSIIGVVVRKVKIFVRHIRAMFYVRIKFSHSFHFETNQSKSMSEITTGIVTEIRHRTENILAVFDFMSCATSLFFLFIILRVLHYRYKFLTSERFDNRFITNNFRDIDMRRAQLEKETVLPLNHRERLLYITVTSVRLVKSEKVKLSKAAVVLGTTTLKLSTHMMADYALYWVLTVIRYHARFQSTVQAPNVVGLHIEGEGFIAKLLKSIVKAFQPLGIKLEIDTVPCLPDPIPPDYDRYVQIVSLLILCWILTIFEPYGLRLRHSVMCYYHPTRARQRSVWLYNHIMRSRSSFLKFARRQLRRKVTGAKGITKITFKEYLRANINIKLCRLCLGSDHQDACLLCGEVFRESDPVKPIRCIKPGCPGIYCEQCYADLQNLCTVCMEPIQYGDLSDVSEEKDSSGDEAPLPKTKKKKKMNKRCTISKCLKGKHGEDSDDEEHGLLKTHPSDFNKSEKSDSDYNSGSSTDNSYSYQNKKDLTSKSQYRSTPKFKDVEKQRIPNYATWHSSINPNDSETEPYSDGSTTDSNEFSQEGKKNSLEQVSKLSIQLKNLELEPDIDESRESLEKFFEKIDLDRKDAAKYDTNLTSTSYSSLISELNSDLELESDTVDSKVDSEKSFRKVKIYTKDTAKYDANLSSTSHSSLISELDTDLQLESDTVDSRARSEKFLRKVELDSTHAANHYTNFVSTSHSSLISELKKNEKEKPEFSLTVPYNKHGKNRGGPRYSKDKKHQQYNAKSVSSEKFTNFLKLSDRNESHKQNTTNRYILSRRDIDTNLQDIPLTDRTYVPLARVSRPTESDITTTTETSFIETPKKNIASVTGASSSLDSEIEQCQKCGKLRNLPIPPLNLDFSSSKSSSSTTRASPTVTDRFRQNVKYEIIQETPSTSVTSRSYTFKPPFESPKTPLNISYQIYVPRFDTFLESTDLVRITAGQKHDSDFENHGHTSNNNNFEKKEKSFSEKISEYKGIQREKRIEDLNKKSVQKTPNTALNENPENTVTVFSTSRSVDSTLTEQTSSCFQEPDKVNKVHSNNLKYKQKNAGGYELKVKDYYKEINRKQPTDNPITTKDQNKLVNFFKRIFRKVKNESELSQSPESKFRLGECDKRFVILSPKLTKRVSSAEDDHSGAIASTSTSGDAFLNQHSTGTSTRSSSSSLMGSTTSHIRGGAESKLENSAKSIFTSGTSEIATSGITPSDAITAKTTDITQEEDNASDSEISDINIFFGHRTYTKKRKLKRTEESQTSDSTIAKIDKSAFKDETDETRTNLNKTKSIIPAEGTTPRYSTQPIEPTDRTTSRYSKQLAKPTEGTTPRVLRQPAESTRSAIEPAEVVTPRYSRQPAERDQHPSFQEPEVDNWYSSTNNKMMNDPYTSSEISPAYIENVRGRGEYSTYPYKSPQHAESFNENSNANGNKIMCMRYPSREINPDYMDNMQGKCCTCPVKPQQNSFNIKTYACPNQTPRPPPCYASDILRERKPTANSPQECCNKIRSVSQERHRHSSGVRFSKSTEMSAPIIREYSSSSRTPQPAMFCNCSPRSPIIDEIRGRLVEYSGGEPPPNTFPRTKYPEDIQYPENDCACNTFEVSNANVSPRTAAEDDQISYCSGCSVRSQFPDLVYQNTDEFFQLVNELGDTLSQRNRERVQKTMREFEIKSSQNKNLDKPIIFESDSEDRNGRHCLGKKHMHQPSSTKFTRMETRKASLTKCPNYSQRYGYVEKVVQHMDHNTDYEVEKQPKYNKKGSNPHWELNARTGEWYKVYDDYYDYGNEYYGPPPSPPPPPRQICVCERNPRLYYSKNSPEQQIGYFEPPSPRRGKCNNCGCSRDY